jgi:hypothetical protein
MNPIVLKPTLHVARRGKLHSGFSNSVAILSADGLDAKKNDRFSFARLGSPFSSAGIAPTRQTPAITKVCPHGLSNSPANFHKRYTE